MQWQVLHNSASEPSDCINNINKYFVHHAFISPSCITINERKYILKHIEIQLIKINSTPVI